MTKLLIRNLSGIKKMTTYVVLYMVTGTIVALSVYATPEEQSGYEILRFIIVFCATILLSKYFFYMIVSPWYDVSVAYKEYKLSQIGTPLYEPRVSVLIPAWNEGHGVITTVRTLVESTYDNLEIVVINNASTDNTEALMQAYKLEFEEVRGATSRKTIVYANEQEQGKGHALNAGLALAKGDIIMSIDADCYVPRETISNFVRHFKDPKVMAAVGNVLIGNTRTLLGVIQHLEFLFSFYFKKADSLLGTIYIIGGAAGAFRKEVFATLGSYSTTNITEDIELSVRIQDAGMKIVYASDAVVFTEGAVTLSGLMKQRLRWKRGRFETFFEHTGLFFSFKSEHNKMLSWFVLPLAIFGEVQLSLEAWFLFFLYVFSYISNDYTSFISGIIVVSSMFVVQLLFDNRKGVHFGLILLAPICWLLFYVSTFVETQALIRAIWGYVRGHKLEWQKWARTGVFSP
ncbi:MAG: hypothetical protein RLZZ234_771 [Candidatus Parcubacteria bacterium]